jgi:rod shape-determining protein MreB and related proteins
MSLLGHLAGIGDGATAIDLGTTSTVVYVHGRGIVLSEPSLVAVDSRTGKVRAAGTVAKRMVQCEAGSVTAVHPLRSGAITDLDRTEELLGRVIRKAYRSRAVHPRLAVVGVPSGATGLEKSAVEEVFLSVGVRQVHLIEDPLAAAIGAGLPVVEPAGSFVVDIGGGTCEAAVVALGEIVVSQSARVGGEDFDQAIIKHLRREHELEIAEHTAEAIKVQIGSAHPRAPKLQIEVAGRDIRSQFPRTVRLTSEEIRDALERPLARILAAVKETLLRTPPELSSDLIDRGLMLAGGGSLLPGLDERIREETEMPAHVAELPLTCVAAGSGTWLEEGHLFPLQAA